MPMPPYHFWEDYKAVMALYAQYIASVGRKYGLARVELAVLLFLANNPQYDTAKEICEMRYLAKSQVSEALHALEARGLVEPYHKGGNRKTVHLRLLPLSASIVAEGRAAQEDFAALLIEGIPPEDMEVWMRCTTRCMENVSKALSRQE